MRLGVGDGGAIVPPVVVLAGGVGTRLGGASADVPKPLRTIGGQPILWHVLRSYASFGFRRSIVALGHRGEEVRHWAEGADLPGQGLDVALVDTGAETATGGRVRRLAPALAGGRFLLTWCDGLSDVDLRALVEFHDRHGRLATVTAVHPPARFGRLAVDPDGRVSEFAEKQPAADEWINGAFFVCEPGVIEHLHDDDDSLEFDVLPKLAAGGELMAFRHDGFWQCMDTPAEHAALEARWSTGRAPWSR